MLYNDIYIKQYDNYRVATPERALCDYIYLFPNSGLDAPEVFHSPGGKERYWEQVPLVYKKEKYTVEIRECKEEDIVEIDTFSELKAIDKTYDV